MIYISKILEELNRQNLKMVDLANALGINKTVVSAWKHRNTNPPLEYLVQICELLHTTPNELLDFMPKNPEDKLSLPITSPEDASTNNQTLNENQKELLFYFDMLSEREQIKFIARVEDAATNFSKKNFCKKNQDTD